MICLAALSQEFVSPNPYVEDLRDLEFERVQEEWVYQLHVVRRLEDVIPSSQVKIIKRLRCKDYDCREAATDDLVSLGRKGFRAAFWGSKMNPLLLDDRGYSIYAEVVEHCKAVLSSFYRCARCGGSGMCPSCTNTPVKYWRLQVLCYPTKSAHPCTVCDGTGDIRFVNRSGDISERDFFKYATRPNQ